jgi:tetratricopeptide (TPR) repeat protein
MDAERWQAIERIYHGALELHDAQRAEYVRSSSGGDEAVEREVLSLLAQAAETVGFLESPAMAVAAKELGAQGARAHPSAIGRFRILRLIGEGGMGSVYEAEQDEPRRRVAIKMLRPGFATPDRLRRFQQESRALARLQHPGVAQIFESGTADAGAGPQPYFAMELVHGLPLREYSDRHGLGVREKLALLSKTCDAVNHAHQRGLIHRDLKPGNILVDEAGQPKVLDFGVARFTSGEEESTLRTEAGQVVGTLAYMSPEQVLGDPLEVDIRSDVYSLGVILYELLSGRLPYEATKSQFAEAIRAIREESVKPLGSIGREFRGDIETIVSKALEKDKSRRYASAADLGADIQRYLSDEPIAARPPSAGYQFQKFARRHRELMAGLVAVFVVLVTGVAVATTMAVRARQAEAEVRAVNEFLQQDLLAQAGSRAQAGPNTKADPDLKVRTALDRAAARIGRKFASQPLAEASIRWTIGDAYLDLGVYPEAQKHLDRALELRRHLLGEHHRDTLWIMYDLAMLYRAEGKYPQAEALDARVLELRRRYLGEEHPETLDSMNSLGLTYRSAGKFAQAEPLFSKVWEIRRRISGEEATTTLFAMNNLGFVYQLQGKYPQAASVLEKVLDIRRRVSGEEHPDTLIAVDNVATVCYRQRDYARAESLWTKNLEVRRQVLGEEHPDTVDTTNNLGAAYRAEGKLDQAEAMFSQALEIKRRVLGEEHPSTLISMINAAVLYRYKGDYPKAEALMTRAVDVQRRVLGEEHPDRLAGMNRLAALYRDEGKYEQAETLFTKTLTLEGRVLGERHPETIDSRSGLGRTQLLENKFAAAESTLRGALRSYEAALPDGWERYNCQSMLGASLEGQSKYAEAEPLLLSGYGGVKQREASIPRQESRTVAEAAERVVRLYEDWKKGEKVREWRALSRAANSVPLKR